MIKNSMIIAVSMLVLPLIAVKAPAAGVSTTCGVMWLSNVKIGQQYSLKQLMGYNFNVTYRGMGMADVMIRYSKPNDIDSGGFEPIPDINWVKVEKDRFSLDPGQTAETDITLSIPNDEKYMGKKYYAIINPVSGPSANAVTEHVVFGAGLMCKLKFEIASKPPTAEEIRQLRKQMQGVAMTFTATPERIFLNEIEPGKNYNIKKDFEETLKLVNTSDFDVQVEVNSIVPKSLGLFPPTGYEEPINPKNLLVKKNKFKMAPNSITEVPLELKLTNNYEKGKSYYFVVVIHTKSKIKEMRYYTKVYVETMK